jgi:osmotically-inducible protein OsmY
MPSIQTSGTKARTDASIAREIKRKIRRDLEVPDEEISIHVTEGLVTIEGTVTRETQRNATEACVNKMNSIRGIENKILVDSAFSAVGS